jgi:hypothetical protein
VLTLVPSLLPPDRRAKGEGLQMLCRGVQCQPVSKWCRPRRWCRWSRC